MTRACLLAALLALAGCAITPRGGDEDGLRLKAAATPVLHALIKYRKDRGVYPQSLFELTPKYIAAIPFEPGLNYDRDAGAIAFHYERLMLGEVQCRAPLGDVEWTCR